MKKYEHRQQNRRVARLKLASTQRNFEAFDTKRTLLQMYETMGVENDYVRDLRRRVRIKQVQLLNRDAEGINPKYAGH